MFLVALFKIAPKWKQLKVHLLMCKQHEACPYSGILFSQQKRHNYHVPGLFCFKFDCDSSPKTE